MDKQIDRKKIDGQIDGQTNYDSCKLKQAYLAKSKICVGPNPFQTSKLKYLRFIIEKILFVI